MVNMMSIPTYAVDEDFICSLNLDIEKYDHNMHVPNDNDI